MDNNLQIFSTCDDDSNFPDSNVCIDIGPSRV
jgi:hypothetical protein